jgi:uncharacterized protein (TIGR03435 family)
MEQMSLWKVNPRTMISLSTTTIAGLLLTVLTASAQTAVERPRFEAAAVQHSAPAMNPFTYVSGGAQRGERYDLRKATMLDLIRIAYDVDPDTVFGGPNWLEFDRFDIAAKLPAATPPATIRSMLQSLLAERFGLVIRHDTRPMPSFALGQGKTKPKLQRSDGPGDGGCNYVPQPNGSIFTVYSCRNVTMAVFAQRLHALARDYLVEPVIDRSQLEGSWDLDLRWNARARLLPPGAERITIFDALQKDLGLTLTLKDSPQSVLVVDHVEQPAPDPPGIAAKLPQRGIEFEVSDLKPSGPDETPVLRQTGGGGLEVRAVRLEELMTTAWDIDSGHPERISGVPRWAQSAKLDINAKPPASANALPILGSGYIDDEGRLMLRNLLIERFQIKWHYENRRVTASSLVALKPKLARPDPSRRATCQEGRVVKDDPRDTNPMLSSLFVCQHATMAQFASRLQPLDPLDFSYPVEDATGLRGSWDFRINFSPTWLLRNAGREAADGGASEPTGGISIQDAIEKQLGLKLERRKRMLPVVVIDHIEEKPVEN